MTKVFVYDSTSLDKKSAVRGVGRYLQILKENFPDWTFINNIENLKLKIKNSIFINPFFNFLKPPLTLNRLAKKQIAVIHDLIPLKYPFYFPTGIRGKINIFLNKLALKNYDLIITDSKASKDDITNILKIPENKIKVVYPCLPRSFLKLKIENLKLKIENYCLYVGDATWNKNLVNLAKAIKIANVACVMVGKIFEKENINLNKSIKNKWLKEYQQFLKETENDKRFIFAGFLKDEELINYYQNASLNILASRDEGFGFSFLEASSCGCPSILSNIKVFKEISQEKLDSNLCFFDPNNPYDIADKIVQIYFDKKIQKKLANEAKKISRFFLPEKFKKEFLKIISE
ncbi:MAG: glycosyltransferase family 4 protein [Patescibacteria group bacterium]|nr:glycosyltransferase family 4 protein [Patescibacteria group bacterium]